MLHIKNQIAMIEKKNANNVKCVAKTSRYPENTPSPKNNKQNQIVQIQTPLLIFKNIHFINGNLLWITT